MSEKERDPTIQVEAPKGSRVAEQTTELTTGDFESVRPVTVEARLPSPLPSSTTGALALALGLLIAACLAAYWFLFHMPLVQEQKDLSRRLMEAEKRSQQAAEFEQLREVKILLQIEQLRTELASLPPPPTPETPQPQEKPKESPTAGHP